MGSFVQDIYSPSTTVKPIRVVLKHSAVSACSSLAPASDDRSWLTIRNIFAKEQKMTAIAITTRPLSRKQFYLEQKTMLLDNNFMYKMFNQCAIVVS